MAEEFLTFEQFEHRIAGILKRTDYYDFVIEGAVRVKREITPPFGNALWIQGVHHNPNPEQKEWFSKVMRKIEEVEH